MGNIPNRYDISIKNCTSFDQADIVILPNTLNIKYGFNGTGKSSIARAIRAAGLDDGSLKQLQPFKHRGKKDAPMPSVEGAEGLENVLVFDEQYVSKFLFQRDEVVANSFEVFVRTDDFDSAMQEIADLLKGITQSFANNEELSEAIDDLRQLRDAFKVTKGGEISKSSKGYKALEGGNKIENIPDHLKDYSDFLRGDKPAEWISWQAKGNNYLQISDNCPYCAADLSRDGKKETPLGVSSEYVKSSIDQLEKLQSTVERLGEYLSEECWVTINEIIKGKVGLSNIDQTFLVTLKAEADTLFDILNDLKNISFFTFRDIDVNKVDDWVKEHTVELSKLSKLDSPKTHEIVDPINEKLGVLLASAGSLKEKIGRQKGRIVKAIRENEAKINDFLKTAGYRYIVEILGEENSYRMRLRHQDNAMHIDDATNHLSFGEKNAFALILFMFEALSKNPDIVILDDPISSFDNNKKFAIIHRIFKGENSFRGMTVLMLTHDFEPAIDMIRVSGVRDKFQSMQPAASFLKFKEGVVSEQPVAREKIKNFNNICRENISSNCDEIIKLIYLRRLEEVSGSDDQVYQLISNCLHGEDVPFLRQYDKDTSQFDNVEMTAEQIQKAEKEIGDYIPGFNYLQTVSRVKDVELLKGLYDGSDIGYEKLQLFRSICETTDKVEKNDVIMKFVNETFHVENEYVMQLNPREYDPVPEYVVLECDRILREALESTPIPAPV